MIKFKAKIKDSEEWIEGYGCVFETSMNEWVIFKEGIHWCDCTEWCCGSWEKINIETIIIEKEVNNEQD
jgi:hypothetical protein